ncbi:MAG: hypothetical protein ACFFF4_09735 [Candidatus Thorarchaeota archaeon]
MNEIESSDSAIISKPRRVLWGVTLLVPASVLITWGSVVWFAPVWITPFGWDLMFIISVWLMTVAPLIVAAIVLDLNIRGIGKPLIIKLAIVVGAIIPIAYAYVFNYLHSMGFTRIIPLPIASLIQYIIFQKMKSS